MSDFGLAKFTEGAAELTGSGMIVGTPGYMAPEQAAGVKRIGPAADVYALGAILFELLTGRPPFDGTEPMSVLVKVVNGRPPDVRSLRPDCPRDLAAVAMLCLEKDPDRRYPSAEALADDLARYLANRPTAARRPHPVEQFAMAVRRNPVAAGLLFLLVATFAAAIGVAAVQWRLAVAAVEAERASRAVAEDALTEAGDERRRADGRQMLLEFDRAARRCEEGQVGQGVAGFVTALELAEKLGDADRARVARVNLAAWQARLFQQMYSVRHAEKGRARAVAFTPDGAALVTAGDFATLRLWDAATGRPVRELVPSVRHFRGLMITPTFWAVAVNPAGTRVAVGGSDGQVWVWDPGKPDSRTAWPATPPGGEVWSLTFAPDGSLWTGDDGGRVRRWDADTGKSLADLPTQVRAVVTAVVVSRDGTRLLAADRAGGVSEWDVPGRREVRRYTPEGAGWVTDVALSPDETLLAATGTYATADVWDRATGARVAGFDLAGAHGTGVAFAPDGRHLVAADNGGIVRAWDRTARGPTFPPLRVPGAAQPVRFRPGTRAFAVPAGSTVGVWRLPAAGGADLGRPDGEPIRALDFDPAGKRLLVVRRNLEVYDSETAAAAAARTYAVKTPSLTARFDPHRPRLVRTDRGGWWAVDAETGAESRPAGWERSYVDQLEFAPGGAGFLTGDPTAVFAWDAAGRDRRRLPASDRLTSSEPLRVLRYRSDGKEIMVGAADRLEFLDPATGHPTREPIALPDAVEDACYTPDGSRVVVGLRNATARVWNLATGTPDGEPLPHASAVACVAVSPDGATLLTGSRDGTARFWDAATGLALGPPLRHATAVTAVAFSPDGRRAATGTVGSRARLWDAPPAPAAGPPADFRGRGAGTTP